MTTGRRGVQGGLGRGPAVAALSAALLVPAGAARAEQGVSDGAGAEV